jgi:hypothetical protein
VKVPTAIRSSCRRSSGQVAPQGALGDADEEEGEPAQDDVSADALFLAVVDRAEVDDLLEAPPAALDFQQLPVSQGDVLGAHRRVGGAQQVLAVEVLLGLRLAASMRSRPPGVARR